MKTNRSTRRRIALAVFVLAAALLLAACAPAPSSAALVVDLPEPPTEGASNPTVLLPREDTDSEPSFQTNSYTVFNDGTAADWILVSAVWNFDNKVPDGFAVMRNSWTEFDGFVFQNYKGNLIIWKYNPPDGGG